MRINFKFVFITIVLLVTMVPVFRFSSIIPDYEIVSHDAGKILISYDTGHVRGALIIAHKSDKLVVYGDKLLKGQLESFDLPGKLVDYGGFMTNEKYSYFLTLNSEGNVNRLRVFYVDEYNREVLLKNTTVVSSTNIFCPYICHEPCTFTMYDSNRKILALYNVDGILTDAIDTNVVSCTISYYHNNGLFVYNGSSLTQYIFDSGKIIKGKTTYSLDYANRKNAPVFPSDDLYSISLYDRNKVIYFDQNLEICFSMYINGLNKASEQGNFYNNKYGCIYVANQIGREYLDNIPYKAVMFQIRGYRFKEIQTNYPGGLYEYSSGDSNGFILFHGKDQIGDYAYQAYSGVPRGIDYLIRDYEEGNVYTFYVYCSNGIYITKYNNFEAQFRAFRTVGMDLPADVIIVIDWGQYVTLTIIIVVCLLTTGALNTILKLF